MPLRILADRNRSGAYLIVLLIGTALFRLFFFLTIFVQDVLGYSAVKAGAAFLPIAAAIVVVSAAVALAALVIAVIAIRVRREDRSHWRVGAVVRPAPAFKRRRLSPQRFPRLSSANAHDRAGVRWIGYGRRVNGSGRAPAPGRRPRCGWPRRACPLRG